MTFFRSPSTGRFRILLTALILWYPAAGSASSRPIDPSDPEVRRSVGAHFGPGASGAFLARDAMVTSASHHATLAGLEILRAGGNAFDAAVAVQFVLNVAEPYGSGIGGGLFAVAYDSKRDEVFALDGREESPRDFDLSLLLDPKGKKPLSFRQRITGGAPVGVPGTFAACLFLLENHGTLPLADVLEPAIRLAEDGFRLPEPFAANLAAHWDRLSRYPASVELFARSDGSPLRTGDLFRNPDLAATFRALREGRDNLFYRGELAEEIVATVREDSRRPGVLTLEDMTNYRAVLRSPVESRFGEYTIYGMNLPSSGGPTLALMLNLLQATPYADLPPGSPLAIRTLIDVQNLAFADRNAFMADADFVDVPLKILLSPEYAAERASLVLRPDSLSTPLSPGLDTPVEQAFLPGEGLGEWVARLAGFRPVEESRATTHFSVVDRDRNVVSITSTLEQHFGSAITVPGRGFLLNNELTDFTAKAGKANTPAQGWRPRRSALGEDATMRGGKRPRSSMSPTLVFRDGKPFLALGSPGGSRIIGVVLNMLVNRLVHDREVQEAVNAPRVISRNGSAELETPLLRNTPLMDGLKALGIEPRDAEAVGAVQAIEIRSDGWLAGAADPRREGLALGF